MQVIVIMQITVMIKTIVCRGKKRKGSIKAKNIGMWFLTNMAGGVIGGGSGYVAVKVYKNEKGTIVFILVK